MDADLRVRTTALIQYLRGLKAAAAGDEPLLKTVGEADAGIQAAIRALQTAVVRKVAFSAGAAPGHPEFEGDLGAHVDALGTRLAGLADAVKDGDDNKAIRDLVEEGNAGLASVVAALSAAAEAKIAVSGDAAADDSFQIVWGDGTVVKPTDEEVAAAREEADKLDAEESKE